jgi:hypothetical protein
VKTEHLRSAVESVLNAVAYNTGPVLSEAQYLRELVGVFANKGAYSPVLMFVPGLHRDEPQFQRLHERFRTDLQAIVDDRLSAESRKRIHIAADRMIMIPKTDDDGRVVYRYLPESIEAALAHALRLLLDPAKAYAADFKQCQWRECNHITDERNLAHVRGFFFVSERREAMAAAGKQLTGKLPDRYCCAEHMRAAHRERATEATIKRRKELREGKLKANARRR